MVPWWWLALGLAWMAGVSAAVLWVCVRVTDGRQRLTTGSPMAESDPDEAARLAFLKVQAATGEGIELKGRPVSAEGVCDDDDDT